MPTGFEVSMYRDIERSRLALEKIAIQLARIADALELGASVPEPVAAQAGPPRTTEDGRGDT